MIPLLNYKTQAKSWEKKINKTRSWTKELTVWGGKKDIKVNELKSSTMMITRNRCDNEAPVDE